MSPIPGHHLSETTWRRSAAVAFFVLTLVFAGLLYRAEHHTDTVERRVAKVESPCLKYGAKSEQCKEAFEQAVLTITHAQACAILRKAGLEIEECAHARLRQEHRRGKERAATAQKQSAGGGAHQTGSTGPQQQTPSSKGGGGTGKGGVGGGEGPAAPGKGGSGGAPAPPKGGSGAGPGHESPAPPATEAAKPQQGTVPGTVEATGKAAGEVVEEVGGAAQGVVEGAGKTGDCVLRGNC